MPVQFGDVFVCVGPSGGGYGDPLERDPEAVRQDVIDGIVSPETRGAGLWRRCFRAGTIDWPASTAMRADRGGV